MHVEIPAGCGNAPRQQIISRIVAALHEQDLPVLREWLHPGIRWEIAGEAPHEGAEAVEQRSSRIPDASRLQFLGILTHGKEGSADARITTVNGTVIGCSHVFQFASAGKAAKLVSIRSYFVDMPADSGA